MTRRTKARDRTNGTPSKATGRLQEAIIAAAQKIGRDGDGKEGLTGYCCQLAQDELWLKMGDGA